ncbi:MAG: tRNA (adenosine(37)-N6)-dimethylallyltransferase MiaA [Steroidobacteraceae bacterium]
MGDSHPRDVILIMGPTASGKTDLALRLAKRFPVALISVDSAMVYRGMNIGTGKPDPATLARYPHSLVDIRDPAEAYSAGQFRSDAIAHIESALQKGRVPVLVGGTMLYFRALTQGLAELPAADPAIRAHIDAEAAQQGWPALHAQLASIDPVAAARIQPNDGQRIQRALEVHRISGRTLTELHLAAHVQPLPYRFHAYAWSPADREQLYARIEQRFTQMMSRGLLDEVNALYRRGDLTSELPAIRSVGYRQLWEHLAGSYPLEEGVRRAILATRHLARRQLIWLRGLRDINWLDALELTAADDMYRCIEGASANLFKH